MIFIRVLASEFLKMSEDPCLSTVARISLASQERTATFMRTTLRCLAEHPRAHDFVFATPAEAMAILGGSVGVKKEAPKAQTTTPSHKDTADLVG